MARISLVRSLAVLSVLALASGAGAGETHGTKGPGSTCLPTVHITEAAERQPGGALYQGPAAGHHKKQKKPMPQMKGAHQDHKPRHGGAFFMAPNKIHHLEGVFREGCGFQVVFYNTFTKRIHVDRFRAFINVVPDKQHEPEVMRFLSANGDNTALYADIGDTVTKPFGIELFVEFPESEDPQLFNFRVTAPGN